MSFKRFSYLVWISAVTFLFFMLFLVYKMLNIQNQIKMSEINRYESINLAFELFQSSEDLTRMARTYAVTKDPKYKQIFYKILDIRNGKISRPKDYSLTFWQLYDKTDNIQNSFLPDSLNSLMRKAKFTNNELKELNLAQENSDFLADTIEQEAFVAMKGDYKNIDGKVIAKKKPNQKLAIDLLYSQAYIDAKKEIMQPIDNVIRSVERRTYLSLEKLQSSLKFYMNIMWFMIISAIFGVFLLSLYSGKKFVEPLKKLSQIEPLTGLINRRHFFYLAKKEIAKLKRSKNTYSILIFDIDDFKNINDSYGHYVGDNVLIKLSEHLSKVLREVDVISRWGGDEFLVMMPDTDNAKSLQIAERLRQSIEQISIKLKDRTKLKFTISIGVSSSNSSSQDLNEIIEMADKALYKSKQLGRNRVESCWSS